MTTYDEKIEMCRLCGYNGRWETGKESSYPQSGKKDQKYTYCDWSTRLRETWKEWEKNAEQEKTTAEIGDY